MPIGAIILAPTLFPRRIAKQKFVLISNGCLSSVKWIKSTTSKCYSRLTNGMIGDLIGTLLPGPALIRRLKFASAFADVVRFQGGVVSV